MYDYLIVGGGLAGCVLAERIASQLNKKVILIEKREHIGGNAYDYYNNEGILVHKYGPHIFHTNNKKVWNYISNFCEWYHYQHRVLAYVDGYMVPFPVNLDTINILYGEDFSVEELKKYYQSEQELSGIKDVKNARDMAISRVGESLYNLFFRNYTKKQWDLWPEELGAEVTARIPLRISRDDRYFSDRYQGLPKYGYTEMFRKMLRNSNIHILLQTDYKSVIDQISFNKLIYTGPIDYYYDYLYGKLPYRSIYFEMETLQVEKFQEVGTVNFPNDYDFTRITEFKHMTGQKHVFTTIMREYPNCDGEPYYPIPKEENRELYNKYSKLTGQNENVFFSGRLAEYQYYNMDVVIEKALELFDNICN